MKVFAFSGSLRTGSFNTRLLKLCVPLLEARGLAVDVWDYKGANVPVYDADVHEANYPPALADAKARILASDGVLICTPEYNHGLPGGLKNAVDILTRPARTNPFRGLVFAQLGCTPGGFATLHAQEQLRQLVDAVGGWSLSSHFVVSKADSAFDEAGQLVDEKKRAELEKFLDRYVDALKKLRG